MTVGSMTEEMIKVYIENHREDDDKTSTVRRKRNLPALAGRR